MTYKQTGEYRPVLPGEYYQLYETHPGSNQFTSLARKGTRKPHWICVATTKMCTEGCNPAQYVFINGNEKEYLCGPSFADRLLDLVTNNERILFTSFLPDEDGLPVISVGGEEGE
jgi:hypothetical protein